MDLSWMKWPLIILIVVGLVWLVTEGGVNWMYNKFSSSAPGVNAEKDKVNEAGLSRLGGFLLKTFRYAKAETMFRYAVERYPTGDNYWYNRYRIVKCLEKQGRFNEAVNELEFLMQQNAGQKDPRVPNNDNLKLRSQKIIEVNDLRR